MKRQDRPRLYHLGFADMVTQAAPPEFSIHVEVPLSLGSRRIDLLLVRQREGTGEAKILRQLWRHLGKQTLLDFKGPSRGFRKGELVRLDSYGGEYLSTRMDAFEAPSHLSLVLVVPQMTPTLAREIGWLSLRLEPLEPGYARLLGSRYTMLVVCLDQVAQTETLLLPFTPASVADSHNAERILTWLKEMNMDWFDVKENPDLDEMAKTLAELLGPLVTRYLKPEHYLEGLKNLDPEQRLAGLAPEQIIAGLAPEQIIAGLDPEQIVAGLDAEGLAELQKALQRRLNET